MNINIKTCNFYCVVNVLRVVSNAKNERNMNFDDIVQMIHSILDQFNIH